MKSRRPCLAIAAISLTAVAASSVAAEKRKPEIGITLASLSAAKTSSGYSDYYEYSSDTTLTLSVPGDAFLGLTAPGLHVAIPAGEKLCIEPQASLLFATGGGDTGLLLSPTLQVNVAPHSWQSKTTYFFGRGGAVITTGDGSDAQIMAGFGVGYRIPVRDFAVMRWEAYYNRYFDAHSNQLGVHLKVGIVF